MPTTRRSSFLLLAAILAATGGCGDSNGPGGPSTVALFTNSAFVAYDTATFEAQASQMAFSLRSFGVAVAPVTAFDSVALDAVLTQNRVFIVPTQQNGLSLADSLTPGAKTFLRWFVDSLSGVLILNSDQLGLDLLDTLFNYAVVQAATDSNYQRGAEAAGTPFAGGPALVWDNQNTSTIEPSTLPPSHIIYKGASGGAAVVVIPKGKGAVVLLGWDWYTAAPHGPQDGGWLEVLRRALRS